MVCMVTIVYRQMTNGFELEKRNAELVKNQETLIAKLSIQLAIRRMCSDSYSETRHTTIRFLKSLQKVLEAMPDDMPSEEVMLAIRTNLPYWYFKVAIRTGDKTAGADTKLARFLTDLIKSEIPDEKMLPNRDVFLQALTEEIKAGL